MTPEPSGANKDSKDGSDLEALTKSALKLGVVSGLMRGLGVLGLAGLLTDPDKAEDIIAKEAEKAKNEP